MLCILMHFLSPARHFPGPFAHLSRETSQLLSPFGLLLSPFRALLSLFQALLSPFRLLLSLLGLLQSPSPHLPRETLARRSPINPFPPALRESLFHNGFTSGAVGLELGTVEAFNVRFLGKQKTSINCLNLDSFFCLILFYTSSFSFTTTSLPLNTTARIFLFSIPLSINSVSYFFSSTCFSAAFTAASTVSFSSLSTVLNSMT